MVKRYILTTLRRGAKKFNDLQIGGVFKTLPALKKHIPEAVALSQSSNGEYSIWAMTYDAYGNPRKLVVQSFTRTGRMIAEQDVTMWMHISPRVVPEFPPLE